MLMWSIPYLVAETLGDYLHITGITACLYAGIDGQRYLKVYASR